MSVRVFLAILLCATLAVPAHAQPSQGNGRPPPQPTKPIQLGGTVTYGPESFELIAPKAPVQACSSPAFTAAEIERAAPRSMVDFVVAAPGKSATSTRSVKLPARNGRTAQTIPLTTYVQQLNDVERFYNQHGLTLRHGALAAPKRAIGGLSRQLPACKSRDDFPRLQSQAALIRYRLIDAPEHGTPGGGGVGNVPELKPNPRGPGDVMHGGIDLGIGRVFDPATLTLEGKLRYRAFGAALPALDGGAPLGVTQPMSGSACPVACTYKLDETAFLTQAAKDLIERPNEVVATKYGCKVLTWSMNNAQDCPKDLKFKISDTTRRQSWEAQGLDVGFFLAHYTDVCAALKKIGPAQAASLYKLNQSSKGNESVQTGAAAASFFDGSLAYSNTGIADCVLQMGSSNSLFGARFCLRYGTEDTYSPPKGYHVRNSAGMVTGVTLFGSDFDLVNGDAVVLWNQPAPLPSMANVVPPTTSSTLPEKDEVKTFEGPGAHFAIGPVPVSIRSFAQASLQIGKPTSQFVAPPMAKGQPGTGLIPMRVGGTADVSVGMEAGIDAFVLSAGVSGKLSVLNNAVTGGITSAITPSKNELLVSKDYTFQSTALKGSISAYVEVDLLLYSERYEIEIVSFPGITKTWPLQSESWGPIRAVIPSSAVTSKPCAN
ncbi:hypothetical protein [Xanthomonas bundabergensis]|uniref:hypothetical protein n=1 Tax=Xanthomonas bundabergensis TaxID=3160842 RepID=UPI00351541BF